MANYKQLFMRYMDQEGIKYTDTGDNTVKVVYTGDNIKSIPIFVYFDKDGDPIIQLKCWEIANFKNKEAKGMIACNQTNKEWRWIKFYLDDDADIIAGCDAYIDDVTCGKECLSLVRRMVNIIDDAYPTFGKALWS